MFSLPTRVTLFPYTTLFRSYWDSLAGNAQCLRRELNRFRPVSKRIVGRGGKYPREIAHGVSVVGLNRQDFLPFFRSEEHTSELQSPMYLVCRLLLEKKNKTY